MRTLYFTITVFMTITTFASDDILIEKVNVQSQIECVENNQSMGKKEFSTDVDVHIYHSGTETMWGTGKASYDYPHEVEADIWIMTPEQSGINIPKNYAMTLSTFVKAYTGASWGDVSSVIYFDSFKDFSPMSQHGRIYYAKNEKDYCSFKSIVMPIK